MSRRRQATDTLTGHWTQAELQKKRRAEASVSGEYGSLLKRPPELFGKSVWTGCDWPEEEQKAYKADLRKAWDFCVETLIARHIADDADRLNLVNFVRAWADVQRLYREGIRNHAYSLTKEYTSALSQADAATGNTPSSAVSRWTGGSRPGRRMCGGKTPKSKNSLGRSDERFYPEEEETGTELLLPVTPSGYEDYTTLNAQKVNAYAVGDLNLIGNAGPHRSRSAPFSDRAAELYKRFLLCGRAGVGKRALRPLVQREEAHPADYRRGYDRRQPEMFPLLPEMVQGRGGYDRRSLLRFDPCLLHRPGSR